MIIVPPIFTVPNGLNVVPSPLNWRPCITAFGTKFPPKFSYPSKVHKYKPLSMCTLQTRPSPSARAVVDVPGAITATRQTNAQAKASELIMIFVNVIFIVVLSFLLSVVVLAFFCLLIVRSHLRPFTDVLGRIGRFVTRKVWKLLQTQRTSGRWGLESAAFQPAVFGC